MLRIGRFESQSIRRGVLFIAGGFLKKQSMNRACCDTLERRLLFTTLNEVFHHGDAFNDGANLAEAVLTSGNVNPTDFSKQFSTGLDGGTVTAQPLYVQNVNITTGAYPGIHSVVYIATMLDGLFAIDANNGKMLWHDNFTNTSDPTNLTPTTGVGPMTSSDISDTTGGPFLGIQATPAIDLAANEIFVTANTREQGTPSYNTYFVQRLWGVNLSSGAAVGTPGMIGDTLKNANTGNYTYIAGPIVNGTGNNFKNATTYPNTDKWSAAPGGNTGPVTAFNALIQMERPAVTLTNGTLYLAFASHNDNGPYYGWIMGFRESDLSLVAAFNTVPTYPTNASADTQYLAQGGIWMSGSGIATDGTYLYVMTGNGGFNGTASNFDANGFPIDHDYGDSLLKLSVDSSSSPTNQNGNGWGLKVSDFFTPSNQYALNMRDLDLGSGGVTLLPNNLVDAAGNPMLVIGGKESRIYLIDRNNLGKFNSTYPQTSTTADPRSYDRVLGEYDSNGIDGYNQQVFSSAAYFNGNFYIGIRGTPGLEFSVAGFASGTVPPGTSYMATPVKTALSYGYPGTTFQISANGSVNGVVWAIDMGGKDLLAYDAGSFVTPIYDSNTNSPDVINGGSVKFSLPTIANGLVYLGTGSSDLLGYGLNSTYLNSNGTYFSSPTNLQSAFVSPGDARLNWVSHSSLATEFRVDRSTDGNQWSTLAYVTGSTTTYDDLNVVSNTRYLYRVVGVNGENTTAFSATAVAAPPLTLQGSNLYLKLDPGGANVDVWSNTSALGGAWQSVTLSQLSSISVTGTGSAPSLTIDFSAGDPLPTGGLTFNGGGGTLNILGDNLNDVETIDAASVTFTGAVGAVPINYSNTSAIRLLTGTGTDQVIQTAVPGGSATTTISGFTTSTSVNISAGTATLALPVTGATVPQAQLGSLSVGVGSTVTLSDADGAASRALLVLGSLSLAGTTGHSSSRFDLNGNDLVVRTADLNLAVLSGDVGQAVNALWTGDGITSSSAALDSHHLSALGVIVNNDGSGHSLYGSGAPLGLFDGYSPAVTDLLVANTFFGDANLAGHVDGSDYSRIDNGYLARLTGWQNGDFNYDGVINGSDYTLIDNAFNTQGPVGIAKLAIVTAPQTVSAGTASALMTVQLRDALGKPVVAGASGVAIGLASSSSSGGFYNGATLVSSVIIAAGSSSATFTYLDSQPGSPAIMATSSGLTPATQVESVTGGVLPTQLAFTTSSFSSSVNSASGTITVTLESESGVPVNAAGTVSVSLASNSNTGLFRSLSNGLITNIVIPAGSASGSFTYTDTRVGIPALTAMASGLMTSQQQETITAAPVSIGFATQARTLVVGASPATIMLQLLDQAGNPVVAGAGGVAVSLASTSATGFFYVTGNAALTSLMIPAGASSVSVAYRDGSIGTPTITANAGTLGMAAQQQSVSALPSGTAAFYTFSSGAGFFMDSSANGNTLAVAGSGVSYTSTGLLAGFMGAASFSGAGDLTTNSGSFPVGVPINQQPYTVAAWINIGNTSKNGIVGWGSTGSPNYFRTTQGDAGAADGAGLESFWGFGNNIAEPVPGTLANNWNYVAITYSGGYTGTRTLYLNGALIGSIILGSPSPNATNFGIGVTNLTEYFTGAMTDVFIASSTLTAAQINALYNGT